MTDSVSSNGGDADLADLSEISDISDKDELLALLSEVHVPEASLVPAPGWWLLALVIVALCLVLFAMHRVFKKRQRVYAQNAWRREALGELSQLKESLPSATHSDRHQIVQNASSLMRRVMMQTKGRRQVAGLTANAWLAELNPQSAKHHLDESLYPLLTEAPYEVEPNALETSSNVDSLLSWLQKTITGLPQKNMSSTLDWNLSSGLSSGSSSSPDINLGNPS